MRELRGGFARAGVLLASICISACESPLELDGVERMRSAPVQRTDRYQAAARFERTVVVVGNQGVVLRSDDAGGTWQRQALAGWPALIDATACGDGAFYALAYDRTVFASNDQGRTWTPRAIDSEETPQSITCAPDGRLWVVGSYTSIWSSRDQGASWDVSSRDEDAILTTVQFFDAEHGIVTGEFGMVLETRDAGATWSALAPMPDEFYAQETWFSDPLHGWVIGLGGSVLATADGGASWTREATPTQVSLFGIEPVGGALYVVGGEGTLLRRDDSGWAAIAHDKPIRLYLRAILALDDTHCLVAGVGGALFVIDLAAVVDQAEAG